jgi:hypothetical protein
MELEMPQLPHTDLDSPATRSSSGPLQAGCYVVPEDAFEQLKAMRDLAGFVQDLAAEVDRPQVAVDPARLTSLMQVLTSNLNQALNESCFDGRPSGPEASG